MFRDKHHISLVSVVWDVWHRRGFGEPWLKYLALT